VKRSSGGNGAARALGLLCGAAVQLCWTPALAAGCHSHFTHAMDGPEIDPTRIDIQHTTIVARFSIYPAVDFIRHVRTTYSGSTFVQLDRDPITIFRSGRTNISGDYTVSLKSLPDGAHELRIWIGGSTDFDAGFEVCFRTPEVKTLKELDIPYSIRY